MPSQGHSLSLSRLSLKTKLALAGGFFAIILVLILLAGGWLPGLPEASQKSLPIYTQPGAEKLPVSLFVHPPVSRIQAEGDSGSQVLALQWTNHTVTQLKVTVQSPDDCFLLLRPADAANQASPLTATVEPQQSTIQLLHLVARSTPSSGKGTCLGQRPLILQYSWTINDADLRSRLAAVFPTTQTVGGLTVLIPDVLFNTGKATLKPVDQTSLTRIADILKPYTDLRIGAEGYTDSTGSYVRNLEISKGRADAVKEFFVAHGLNGGHILSNGFGPTSPIADNHIAQGRARNRRVYLVLSRDVQNQEIISTGPIQITTSTRLGSERFFHLAAIVLLPALIPFSLWLAGFVVQQVQERRAALQGRQQRELEIWKAIIPTVVLAIQKHYIPMLSVLSNLGDETSKDPAIVDWQNILAYAMLFRRKVISLTNESGGFYFQNRDAERLCAQLANILIHRFYGLSDRDIFMKCVETLAPDTDMIRVKEQIQAASEASHPYSAMCTAFEKAMADPLQRAQIKKLARYVFTILNYEANAPLFSNWYGTSDVFKEKLTADDLGLLNVGDDSRQVIQGKIKAYLESPLFLKQQKHARKMEAKRQVHPEDGLPPAAAVQQPPAP